VSSPNSRTRIVSLSLPAVLPLVATLLTTTPDRLMWNASASLPIGLYWLQPPKGIRIGTIVAVRPSGNVARLIYNRGYVGPGVPLLKSVAALAGDKVCRHGGTVTVGALRARALTSDRIGRPLPDWQGCLTLRADEVFLLNRRPDSLDGRYFGLTRRSDIIAQARPIWTFGP